MHRYHHLNVSRSQRILLLAAHSTAAATIYFCVTPDLLKWAGIAGLAVSVLIEYRRLIRQGNLLLRVDPGREIIELRQAGQPYFYSKYKVYQTRWFAILKLIDKQKQRTLILNPDCFRSLECYRRCRYDLRRPGDSDAA
jgi:hypothetical protein